MYAERPSSRVTGAVVWTWTTAPAAGSLVLPDGCMDLLLWDDELVVAGPDTRAHSFAYDPGTRISGLRFPPGTGPRVLGVRAHELRDLRVPLGDVWGTRAVRELGERVAGAADRGRALETLALRSLRGEGTGDEARRMQRVAAMLRAGHGVAEVARAVGLSERQLHRRCLDSFGYGAKTLARVLRLRGALSLARGGVPLAETASRAGYADQAHLARDVRALAGRSMTALLG